MRSWYAADVPTLPGAAPGDPAGARHRGWGASSPAAHGPHRPAVRLRHPALRRHVPRPRRDHLAFDTLVRVWCDQGLEVLCVQNVTDIDNLLFERAARDRMEWAEVAERDTQLFRDDMTALRVLPPTWCVGAVEAMDEIATLFVRLQVLGAAFSVAGDVYFSVAAAEHFGQVGGYDAALIRQLSAERGGDPDRPGKKDPLDCLLWQQQRPGEPGWESPLGTGRLGWHVECTAMALNRLGEKLDVQGGGSDLVFPHHELSAAEAAVATGRWPFTRAYVHTGMVGLDGEKMSNSRRNLVFVSQLLVEGTEPAALRLALLSTHYRADRERTPATLEAGEARLAAWRSVIARTSGPSGTVLLEQVRAALHAALDAPAALAAVDAWAAQGGDDAEAPALVTQVVDALLGVSLRS